jgi:hypothetical protein
MVKFFMQTYDIPTKKDVDRLMARLDQIENLIKATTSSGKTKRAAAGKSGGKTSRTASETVLNIIKGFEDGVRFADIKAATGFEDKKLRNIIFRLNKMEKIRRKSRGVYIAH